MPRPKFSLKTLLWLMVVVAAFFAGSWWQRREALRLWAEWEAGPHSELGFGRNDLIIPMPPEPPKDWLEKSGAQD